MSWRGSQAGRRRWLAGIAGIACCLLLAAAGTAAAKPRVIVKPSPGQRVKQHPVRIVVRAGPEDADLKARLNGTRVSKDFTVARPGRRVLDASASHGLRHGRNVLRVVARRRFGAQVRRSTLRFTVAHKRPLTGAGRDRRVVEGRKVELNGVVIEDPRGPSGDRVRWKVVHAPRGSRLRGSRGSQRASGKGAGLRGARTLSPTFKPDVHGTYTLKMTAGGGAGKTSDLVDLDSVHENPLVELHTISKQGGRPAIQVGDTTYPAPFMRKLDGTGYYVEPNTSSPHYEGLFQVLVLDRGTLEMLSSRTYGWCRSDDNTREYTCRINAQGEPVEVQIDEELKSDGPDAMTIVNGMPSIISSESSVDARQQAVEVGLDNLPAIGLPKSTDSTFKAQFESGGYFSVIGVPGMSPGEAKLSLDGGMDGWLLPDRHKSGSHYVFMPSARVAFDTRSTQAPACGAGGCTVAQTVAGVTQSHTEPLATAGGFLVSVYTRFDTEFETSQYFRTVGGTPAENEQATTDMTAFLKAYSHQTGAEAGPEGDLPNLIVISSIHGPDAPPLAGSTAAAWGTLAKQVAALGGTLDRFNTAATTPSSDYTLIGSGSAGEGHGAEATGTDPRVRGVLVPDEHSLFAPVNVNESGPPAEKLMELVVQPPGKQAWPGDPGAAPWGPNLAGANTEGTRAAISAIGGQIGGLGPDPRSTYWLKFETNDWGTIYDAIGMKTYGEFTDPAFTSKEFTDAQWELKQEVLWVSNVKKYLGNLSGPTIAAEPAVWTTKDSVADQLVKSLDYLDAEAEANIGVIEGVFGLVANIADLGSVAAAVKKFANTEHALLSTAAVFELASESVAVGWDGSASISDPDEFRVKADEVAAKVTEELENTADSFNALSEVVVSDYDKLQSVGVHGNCEPGTPLCSGVWADFGIDDSSEDELDFMTTLAQKRMVYSNLLPYAYPVFDTGLSYSCKTRPCSPDEGPPVPSDPLDPDHARSFICDDPAYGGGPFANAPRDAYLFSLERPDAGANIWRTFVSVGRDESTWGWADEDVYKTMFSPVTANGLGIDPLDFMIEASQRQPFLPSHTCYWTYAP